MASIDDHTATLELEPDNYLLVAGCVQSEKVEVAPGEYHFDFVEGVGQIHVKEFVVGQTTPQPEPEPENPGLFEGLFGSLG